ncbi:MAG: hypothetical protein ABI614_08800 [Planctomycetota bacterium]
MATLDKDCGSLQHVIDEIAKLPNVEVGEVGIDSRRIPIVIDLPDPSSLEDMTRRLQGCRGVAFVDVVFVHFEGELNTEN